MRAKYKHILSLLLALFLLLSCAACGQTQVEQPEDTGDMQMRVDINIYW